MKFDREMIEALAHTIKQIKSVEIRKNHAFLWAGVFSGEMTIAEFLSRSGVQNEPNQIPGVRS